MEHFWLWLGRASKEAWEEGEERNWRKYGEKRKNESEVFQNTIKDLQMASDEHSLIGKLQHELMVSKWNEGLVNKKYETILDENRQIKLEIEELEVQVNYRFIQR